MAFPSQTDAATAWQVIRSTAAEIKARSTSLNALSLAGSVGASVLLDYLDWLLDRRADLAAYASTPGLAAYAQGQVNNPSLNITTEFTAMTGAIDDLRTWMTTNFPQNGTGTAYLQAHTFDANGRKVDRLFSTAALATFRTNLQAVIATIG
jgi:hypothetical protein